MKLCHVLARETLKNHEKHYHGMVEAKTEFFDNYKGKKGFFLKKFLINDTFNMNDWKTTWEAIEKDIWNFVGKPQVRTPDEDHPRVKDQDDFKVGEIIDVGIDPVKRTAWQVSHITDKETQELIKAGKIKYGSPTVLKYNDANTEEKDTGLWQKQTTLHRFVPAHDALVAEPAYGKEVDKIPAICEGDGPACSLKLMEVSASVNSDNVNQLTIVPFVKKALNKHFKASTLEAYYNYSKSGESDSCVSKKIKILADEHPTWDHDQAIAVAYSYCKQNQGAIEKQLIVDLAPDILKTKDRIAQEMKIKNNLMHDLSQIKNKLITLHS